MSKIRKIVPVSEDNDQVEKVVQAEDDEQSKQDSEIEDDDEEEEEQELNQDNEEDDSEDESREENPQIQQQKKDDAAVALSPNKNVKVGVKIFTDEDELLLLKSFINFKSETGVDDHNTFLHSIEGNLTLSFPASHTQLREKVRRFKDKYLFQVARGQTAFKNPHQDMIYRLSHEAFGPCHDQQNDDEMETDDEMVEPAKQVDHADYWTLYPKLCRHIESDARVHFLAYDVKEFVKMLLLKLGEKKAKELEEGWKEISVMEVQLCANRLQVLSKQAKAVADALRKSTN